MGEWEKPNGWVKLLTDRQGTSCLKTTGMATVRKAEVPECSLSGQYSELL